MNKIWIQFLSFATSNLHGSNAKSEFQQSSKELTLTGSKTHTPTPFFELKTRCRVNFVLILILRLILKIVVFGFSAESGCRHD